MTGYRFEYPVKRPQCIKTATLYKKYLAKVQ